MTACNTTSNELQTVKPSHSYDTTIFLNDTLGKITVTLPVRYDSFFTWIHYFDCMNCGSVKYRFQPKSLPVYKESSWFWKDSKDSVEQFTIEHRQYLLLENNLAPDSIKTLHLKILNKVSVDPDIHSKTPFFDTTQIINGKQFSIISSEKYDDSLRYFTKTLLGVTLIKGNMVTLRYTLKTTKKDSIADNFIENSKALLYQVKIGER